MNIKHANCEIPIAYLIPHYNGRVFRSYYIYVSNRYGSHIFKEICDELGMPLSYLLADANWVSNAFFEDFLGKLKIVTGDSEILDKAARIFSSPEILNPIEYLLLSNSFSPYRFLRFLPVQFSKFNRINQAKIVECKQGICRLITKPIGSIRPHPDVCKTTSGMLYAIKHLFDLDSISVVHNKCIHNGENFCEFTINYLAKKYWRKKIFQISSYILTLVSCIFFLGFLTSHSHDAKSIIKILNALASLLTVVIVVILSKYMRIVGYASNYFEQSSENARVLLQEKVKGDVAKARVDLAQEISHDIRAPLAALKVASKLADIEQRSYLIDSAIDRISEIAESLLDIDKNKVKENIFVDLKTALETTLEEVKLRNPNLIGTIKFELNKSQSIIIHANRTKIKSLLSNILENAAEATNSAGEVQINVRQINERITIQILDNGIGINHLDLSLIGKKGGTFGKPNGHGLGLYNAKRYLNEIGGDLNISARLPQGAEVTISIPLISKLSMQRTV